MQQVMEGYPGAFQQAATIAREASERCNTVEMRNIHDWEMIWFAYLDLLCSIPSVNCLSFTLLQYEVLLFPIRKKMQAIFIFFTSWKY